MIIDRLENAGRFISLHPGFAAAFEFLKRGDFSRLTPEERDWDRPRLRAKLISVEGPGRPSSKLELHRKYIDIQCLLVGTDDVGWRARPECRKVDMPYDATKDAELYTDEPAIRFTLLAGMFAVMFPEDAHVHVAGPGQHRKVVMKVAAEWEG